MRYIIKIVNIPNFLEFKATLRHNVTRLSIGIGDCQPIKAKPLNHVSGFSTCDST